MIGNCSSLLTQLFVFSALFFVYQCCFPPSPSSFLPSISSLFSLPSILPFTQSVSLSTSFVVALLPASLLHNYLIQSSHLSSRLITLPSIPQSPILFSSILSIIPHPPIIPSFPFLLSFLFFKIPLCRPLLTCLSHPSIISCILHSSLPPLLDIPLIPSPLLLLSLRHLR